MEQVTEQPISQVEDMATVGPAPTNEFVGVFAEASELTPDQSVNVLIQAAQFAQESGNLSLRDSVLLARAVDVLRPGTI